MKLFDQQTKRSLVERLAYMVEITSLWTAIVLTGLLALELLHQVLQYL